MKFGSARKEKRDGIHGEYRLVSTYDLLPKFQFSGGGRGRRVVVWTSQNWKVFKWQDQPKFQFGGGGGGVVVWTSTVRPPPPLLVRPPPHHPSPWSDHHPTLLRQPPPPPSHPRQTTSVGLTPLWIKRQTHVKTLLSPILHMRSVIISSAQDHNPD